MSSNIDEMIDEVLWELRHGVWFSGPYRIVYSYEGSDYCVWYYEKTSRLLKRGLKTLEAAKAHVNDHRELHRVIESLEIKVQ
jgi:hypothetical protein